MECFARCLVISSLLLAMAQVASTEEPVATKPIDVGTEKFLFLDQHDLAKSDGVHLKLHPARKTGEHLIVSEHPWENATLNWFSVVEDQGKYRMWYECYDVDGWPTADDTSFCYAESENGIDWKKPKLGLYSYKGSRDNNILFRQIGTGKSLSRVHGSGVFIDSSAPPESRYKCVSQGLFQGIGDRPYYVAGMTSPDGLTWTRLPQPICPVFADSQYSGFWDPLEKKYVLYGRVGGRGRSIGRSVNDRFDQFPPLSLVAQTDANHPTDSDLYNPACIPLPGKTRLYVMFPSLFRHKADTLDIHMAVSRDGVNWSWPDRNQALIPLGQPGEFDSGSLYMANGCLSVGDELWLYYSGSPLKHEEATIERLIVPSNRRIFSRAVIRRDRLVSVTANSPAGTFETPLIRYAGTRLNINASVREGGSVRVGLVDSAGQALPGRAIDDCLPFTGDHLSRKVAWKDGDSIINPTGKPMRVQFEIRDAEVFSFQFADE